MTSDTVNRFNAITARINALEVKLECKNRKQQRICGKCKDKEEAVFDEEEAFEIAINGMDIEEPEILPSQCCGSIPEITVEESWYDIFHIKCPKCGFGKNIDGEYTDKQKLIEDWNLLQKDKQKPCEKWLT